MSDITVTSQESSSVDITVASSTGVTVSTPTVSSITVTEKGPKGDTGATGPQGLKGDTGQGFSAGGTQYQVLRKVDGDDYNTEWAFADRVTIEVRFDEAVSKGDPLYITGYNNGQNRITVAKADASDSSKMPSIGLAKDDYSQNDNGQATCIGSLEDVNTQVSPNDFQEGDVLYVKAGGGLTNVKPTGTNLIQNVGKVGRRQQNNGQIVVMAIGRSNDVPNIPDGQIWIGNASGVATPTAFGIDLDSSPQLGGNLDTNNNNINFGDADEAVFGDDSNLKIYHAGSTINHIVGLAGDSTYITGGTDLYLRGVNGEEAVTINGNGSVELFHNNVKKAETTSTGLDVTGNIDVSGTVDGVDLQTLNTTVSNKMDDVSDDTTPQLGGDLDVNGNKITSVSNGDITIEANGTGAIIFKSDDIQFDGGGLFQGKIKLYESDITGSNFVALQAPLSLTADTTYTLPSADGNNKDVLQTNGAGTLTWVKRLAAENATHEGTFSLKSLSGGSDALLAFYDDAGDNYIVLRAPDVLTANTTFVLPASDGSADQVLKTDGSGNLSFVDQTTDTNTQNTTTLSFVDSSDDIILRNTTGGAGSGTQDININAGTNITLTHTDANNITIAASGGGSANMENSKTSPTTVGAFNDGARLLTGHTSQAITAGNLVSLTGSGASNVGAQSSVTAATAMLFVATDEADSDELLVEGVVKLSTTTTTSLLPTTTKVGAPVYLSTTAGAVQVTAPSTSGDIVRVVGHVLNATDRVIYFKPSVDWIEL